MAGLLLGVAGSGRASESVQIAATETGRKLDGFIMDDGRAFAVLASADGQPELSLWEGGVARRLDVPGAVDGEVFTIDPLPNGRLVLSSAVAVGNHWGNFTRQVYCLGADGSLETTRGENRYRIEHLWWSPGNPHLAERHVTPWQRGRAPNQAWVSPSGRHALVIEKHYDPEADDPDLRIRFDGRFLELAPAEGARPEVRN